MKQLFEKKSRLEKLNFEKMSRRCIRSIHSIRSVRRFGSFGIPMLGGWLLLAVACKPDTGSGNRGETGSDETSRLARVYVLCEGLYGSGNTSLYSRDVRTGNSIKDIFKDVNGRKLGDTGNDMELYGSKLYIAMNGSNTIEVLDARTARSIRQIPVVDERGVGRQPRYFCAVGDKMYVCSFDNTVCRLDTATLEIEAVTMVGRHPDGICASRGKLYVSNSGGLDYPDYDCTVSVVDIPTFKESKRIEVGHNPYTIATDSRGYVYVCTRGDYGGLNRRPAPSRSGTEHGKVENEGYNFYRIDPVADTVDRVFDLPVLNFCISGDTAYMYHYDYGSRTSWIRTFDLVGERLLNEQFIADGTEIKTPYTVAADPYTGDVYIGDAYNFMVAGSLYCFSSQGRLRYAWHGVGYNPAAIVFLAEKVREGE